jgi:hypothetical protein
MNDGTKPIKHNGLLMKLNAILMEDNEILINRNLIPKENNWIPMKDGETLMDYNAILTDDDGLLMSDGGFLTDFESEKVIFGGEMRGFACSFSLEEKEPKESRFQNPPGWNRLLTHH